MVDAIRFDDSFEVGTVEHRLACIAAVQAELDVGPFPQWCIEKGSAHNFGIVADDGSWEINVLTHYYGDSSLDNVSLQFWTQDERARYGGDFYNPDFRINRDVERAAKEDLPDKPRAINTNACWRFELVDVSGKPLSDGHHFLRGRLDHKGLARMPFGFDKDKSPVVGQPFKIVFLQDECDQDMRILWQLLRGKPQDQ
ncbi:MAG TPA: hypothetical protein VIT68_03765 [Candidatus Gracilibacteria bacterium]